MLDQLELPIVQAPLAGGPSTPELAAAVEVVLRAPRLNALTARSICLSSRRISASDGAPGEMPEPVEWLALRRGAAGASPGCGAFFAPRVPAGSGKLCSSSGSRVTTTPPGVARTFVFSAGALAFFGAAGFGAKAWSPPEAPHALSASAAAAAAATRRQGTSTRIRGQLTTLA